jgi:hypothetical protein
LTNDGTLLAGKGATQDREPISEGYKRLYGPATRYHSVDKRDKRGYQQNVDKSTSNISDEPEQPQDHEHDGDCV